MKKIILLSALTLGLIGIKSADAQIRVGVHINLGGPVYVPAPPPPPAQPVYDDEYYYLPEVEAYYSVPMGCYFYNDGYSWVSATYLPGAYRNYDWRTARRYEIRGNRPYLRHESYRGKFGGYSNRADYYARAFPGRSRGNDRFNGRPDYNRNDNRGNWNRQADGGYNRDRQNGYQQGGRGNYGQQPQGDRGNYGYGQPQQGQGGRGQGNYGQPQGGRGNNGNAHPQGDRGGNRDRGGNDDRRDRGSNGSERFAGNRPGRF